MAKVDCRSAVTCEPAEYFHHTVIKRLVVIFHEPLCIFEKSVVLVHATHVAHAAARRHGRSLLVFLDL